MHPSQNCKFTPQGRSEFNLQLSLLQQQPLLPLQLSLRPPLLFRCCLFFSCRSCRRRRTGDLCSSPLLLQLRQKRDYR